MPGIDPISVNPFHIARAYQAASAPRAAIAPAPAPAEASARSGSVQRLISGVVPGRISFDGVQPSQTSGVLAMYRHPTDKNTAATAVQAGRLLDTTA